MSINVGRQVNLTDFHRDHGLGNDATPLPAALVDRRIGSEIATGQSFLSGSD